MLQAYIDDSASEVGDRRLFLAGYINTATAWILFSEAWAEELRATPKIEYLKMSEANNRSGQFQGWDEAKRDEKIRGLCRVIRHFKPASIDCSVSRKECAEIMGPAVPHGFANPYFLCFPGVMVPLAYSQLQHKGVRVPIDFIFDEQGDLGEQAKFFYEHIRNQQPRAVRALLSKNPIFRDDKLVLPLQAADILAWHVRRHWERGNPDDFMVPDFLSHDGLHMCSNIDADRLRSMASKMSQVPGVERIKTKADWKKTYREIRRLESLGVDTTRIGQKNFFQRVVERIARLIGL